MPVEEKSILRHERQGRSGRVFMKVIRDIYSARIYTVREDEAGRERGQPVGRDQMTPV